ncbi:hypothetical protein M0R89_11570 [Halorussus limi]|uniref:Uncharacterized protein n=1 Tax=Halorussus limi TaxID=2938695 RepID=A0A8U0HR24_9EURY|nr:helix-turn-helix domain-containing protein [Halorussus limi]UPV73186.1 hypothetical protein M0R89_11570 [Halorussus limi]
MEAQNDDKTASEKVLDVLEDEYRATPYLLRERTDLSKQRLNRVLNRLRASGDVTKVCRGLYEIGDGHTNPYTSARVQQRGAIKFADALCSALSDETLAAIEDELDGLNPSDLDFGDDAGDER